MLIKLLGRQLNPTFALLWATESAAILCASRIAGTILPEQISDVAWEQTWVFVVAVMGAMTAMGLYSRRLRDRTAGIVLRISIAVFAGSLIAGLALALWPGYPAPVSQVTVGAAISWLLLVLIRIAGRGVVYQSLFRRRILVLGAGQNAALVLKLRRRADQRGFKLCGFVPVEAENVEVPPDRVLKIDDSLALDEYANA